MSGSAYHVEDRRPSFVPAYGEAVLGPHRAIEVISPEGAKPLYGLPMWDGLDVAVPTLG